MRYALALLLAATACSAGARSPVASPTSAAPAAVDISNYAFAPADVTVRAGGTVTWTERDPDLAGVGGTHSVVADDGSFASPPRLPVGQTYVMTFAKPGTFTYHCGIHSYMTGRVTVT
jgi:plastocyanin